MNLTPEQLDSLTETINIGVGRAAASLGELVGYRVILRVPRLEVFDLDDPPKTLGLPEEESLASIHQSFKGRFSGKGVLIFPEQSGKVLASLLTGEDFTQEQMNDECEGALTEVGNIFLNAILGTMAKMILGPVSYEIPTFEQSNLEAVFKDFTSLDQAEMESKVVLAETTFEVAGQNIFGRVLVFCRIQSLQEFFNELKI